MTFEPLSDHFVHRLESSHASPASPPAPAPSVTSSIPAASPIELFLSDVPDTPLEWLWPGRIPLGHLTCLEAVRSRLLLTPDPTDERQHLLIPTWHPLCAHPCILSYALLFSEQGVPSIHWLAERDPIHLARLSTAPLRSPHRQAILRFLQNSSTPQSVSAILAATCYDPEAGRQMLTRMKLAGELVSPARGLYTTATHPSLTAAAPPVPNVTTTSDLPSPAVLNKAVKPLRETL